MIMLYADLDAFIASIPIVVGNPNTSLVEDILRIDRQTYPWDAWVWVVSSYSVLYDLVGQVTLIMPYQYRYRAGTSADTGTEARAEQVEAVLAQAATANNLTQARGIVSEGAVPQLSSGT